MLINNHLLVIHNPSIYVKSSYLSYFKETSLKELESAELIGISVNYLSKFETSVSLFICGIKGAFTCFFKIPSQFKFLNHLCSMTSFAPSKLNKY